MPKYILEILVPLEGESDEEIVDLAKTYIQHGIKANCEIRVMRHMEESSDAKPESLTFDELMSSLDDTAEKH